MSIPQDRTCGRKTYPSCNAVGHGQQAKEGVKTLKSLPSPSLFVVAVPAAQVSELNERRSHAHGPLSSRRSSFDVAVAGGGGMIDSHLPTQREKDEMG